MNEIDKILWQVRFEEKRNWLKAKRILQKGLRSYPRNKKLVSRLGKLYQAQRLYNKAIEVYLQILQNNPSDEKIIFQLANCYLLQKEYRLALNQLKKINSSFPELHYNRAYAYSKLEYFQQAIAELEQINMDATLNELPIIFQAELNFINRNYEKALKLLDKAEKKFGEKGTIYYLRGLINVNKRHYLKAFVEFKYAEKMRIDNIHFLRNYAYTCEQIGKDNKAIEVLLLCLKKAPFDIKAHIDLGKLYLKLDRVFEAYSIIEQAKRNLPFSVSLAMLLNQIKEKIDKLEE